MQENALFFLACSSNGSVDNSVKEGGSDPELTFRIDIDMWMTISMSFTVELYFRVQGLIHASSVQPSSLCELPKFSNESSEPQ